MDTTEIIMEARPCEDVRHFAARMVVTAWENGATVLGEFNSHTLVAKPGMTREQVTSDWDRQHRESYFGADALLRARSKDDQP